MVGIIQLENVAKIPVLIFGRLKPFLIYKMVILTRTTYSRSSLLLLHYVVLKVSSFDYFFMIHIYDSFFMKFLTKMLCRYV